MENRRHFFCQLNFVHILARCASYRFPAACYLLLHNTIRIVYSIFIFFLLSSPSLFVTMVLLTSEKDNGEMMFTYVSPLNYVSMLCPLMTNVVVW
jgi:hypothetical protein